MVLFYYGPNTFASRRKLQATVAAYVAKTGSSTGMDRLDGKTVKYDDLVAAVQAIPFLASSRLVIIEDLGANRAVADKIEALVQLVPASTIAVFYESAVDQRTTYFKTLLKLAKAVKFEALPPAQLAAWVRQETKSLGASIERGAVARLIELAGNDQWRLSQELNKLANFASGEITAEDVNKMVEASDEQSIFELVDALAAGNQKRALKVYQGLLAGQVNEIYILSMVIWQLRNLLLAVTAGDTSARELAAQTGLSPFVAEKAMQKRGRYDEQTLKEAFLKAVDTDYAIKSGQGEPKQLVELLIYHAAALASR